jgi:hypothetical protein
MKFSGAENSICRVVCLLLCQSTLAIAQSPEGQPGAVAPAVEQEAAPADPAPLAPVPPVVPVEPVVAPVAPVAPGAPGDVAAEELLPPIPNDAGVVPINPEELQAAAELPPLPEVETRAASDDAALTLAAEPEMELIALPGFGDGLAPTPGPPSGFNISPILLPLNRALDGSVRRGLGGSASLSGVYASNPSLGYAGAGESEGSDFYLTLGGGLHYGGSYSDWSYSANYGGGYSEYFENSELSGFNHNAGLAAAYDGGRFDASMNVGFGFGNGANRYYGAVVEELSVNYGLNASYQIGPKTSVTGSFSQSLTDATGENSVNTDSFTASAAAFWAYSPLTQFGPGISYSKMEGDSSMDSVGVNFNVIHKLAQKLSLNSQVGMNFNDFDDGESSDPSLSAAVGMGYRPSPLWGMSLSLFRGFQAKPTKSGGFDELTSISLGYNRNIRKFTLGLGASYSYNDAKTEGSRATDRPDAEYVNLNSSLSMPLFAGRASGSIFVSYSGQIGGETDGDGDSTQAGFSIGWGF